MPQGKFPIADIAREKARIDRYLARVASAEADKARDAAIVEQFILNTPGGTPHATEALEALKRILQ